MNFNNFLNQAWKDHATQTVKVASELVEAEKHIENNEQIIQLASLIVHVMGEHLARWSQGIELLLGLQKCPCFVPQTETERAIQRSVAILQIAQGVQCDLVDLSHSDKIRVFAVASSTLADRDTARAKELFEESLKLADIQQIEKSDPANRALAITGNNLASALELKERRTPIEVQLMILAANAARKYWEIVGTWLEVSRAEYRLAMTYLKANKLSEALTHANLCVAMCTDNQADALDLFYAYEILALTEKAHGRNDNFSKALKHVHSYFEKLSPDDKSWCEESFKKLSL